MMSTTEYDILNESIWSSSLTSAPIQDSVWIRTLI